MTDADAGTDPVRWGILGTAGIAAGGFLPALREAGGGAAISVAGRDAGRTKAWAQQNGVEQALEGYATLLEQPDIEAVYVPLPNSLHAEWTIAALEAGKAVFCEKPLCATPEETEQVLEVARAAPKPLWEAFVFPFHPQTERLQELLADDAIGRPREIMSRFHFLLDDPEDIRLSAELAGGALQDVGCYPIRLARLLFGAEPDLERTIADAEWAPSGVDAEIWGALAFSGDRRLVFSCGFKASYTTATVILGADGEIRITNPFHPERGDELTVVHGERSRSEPAPGATERSFTPAIRHINRALRGAEPPRHLALDEALANATVIAAFLEQARGGR